jgi:hypothetical protein
MIQFKIIDLNKDFSSLTLHPKKASPLEFPHKSQCQSNFGRNHFKSSYEKFEINYLESFSSQNFRKRFFFCFIIPTQIYSTEEDHEFHTKF